MYNCLMTTRGRRIFFFFFSSRRRHTRLTCDWSSDVCSSDLVLPLAQLRRAPSGSASAGTVRAPAAAEWPEAKTEIDVRGFEADDAIRAVERFLEDAHMGGLEKARIIHGKGMGILRERMK